jgi:hypothetical protein
MTGSVVGEICGERAIEAERVRSKQIAVLREHIGRQGGSTIWHELVYILISTTRFFVLTLPHSEADNSYCSAETQGNKDRVYLPSPVSLLRCRDQLFAQGKLFQ